MTQPEDEDDPKPGFPPVVHSAEERDLQREDAPPCGTCGSIMVPSGTLYRCSHCGATTSTPWQPPDK